MKIVKGMIAALLIVYVLVTALLYFAQERLIFPASTLPADYKYQFQSVFRELTLQADDGARLNALHFQTHNPKGIIVYFHGNAGNLSRWGEVVEPFLNMGYEILIVDYRGYGKSTGKRTSRKMYADAELVYQKAMELFPEEEITMYGRSLGSTFATHVAAKFHPRQLILEAPFYSLKSLIKEKFPIFPVSYLTRFEFPTHQFIDEVNCPLSIIHGRKDQVVPYRNAEKLISKASGAELISIENAGHNDLAMYDQYWSALQDLLE